MELKTALSNAIQLVGVYAEESIRESKNRDFQRLIAEHALDIIDTIWENTEAEMSKSLSEYTIPLLEMYASVTVIHEVI